MRRFTDYIKLYVAVDLMGLAKVDAPLEMAAKQESDP